MFVVFLIAYLVLRYTKYGNYVYATGGNKEISRLAGIPTNWVIANVYIVSGFTAAIGGVLLVARLWSAQPNAAVGGVTGTLVGAFILGILSDGLNLIGVPSFYQQVIKGVVLVLAVMLDLYTKRKR